MRDKGWIFEVAGKSYLRGIIAPTEMEARRILRKDGKGKEVRLVEVTDNPPQCPMCAEGVNHVH